MIEIVVNKVKKILLRIRVITQERGRQIQQLRSRIAELEAIVNRTPQQEQELQNKKQELANLERQQQERSSKKYWPWGSGRNYSLLVEK